MTRGANKLSSFLFSLLVFTSLYDPEDKYGLKLYTFIALFSITFIRFLRIGISVPQVLRFFCPLFILVPTISIVVLYFREGFIAHQAFALLKAYLFILIAPVIYENRLKGLEILCFWLSSVSVLTIFIYIGLSVGFLDFDYWKEFGDAQRVYSIDHRQYHPELSIFQVYFYVSPMLILSSGFYFARFEKWRDLRSLLIFFLNILALFLSGTRANMLTACLGTLSFYYVYKNFSWLNIKGVMLLGIVAVTSAPFFLKFFDILEKSNAAKLNLLEDYLRILSDPTVLLFGAGLGSHSYWQAYGESYYITELTYLEIFRNFGIFNGALMIGLLFFPVLQLLRIKEQKTARYLTVAYLLYLLLCLVNPNLFSSMGVLIIALVLIEGIRRKNA